MFLLQWNFYKILDFSTQAAIAFTVSPQCVSDISTIGHQRMDSFGDAGKRAARRISVFDVFFVEQFFLGGEYTVQVPIFLRALVTTSLRWDGNQLAQHQLKSLGVKILSSHTYRYIYGYFNTKSWRKIFQS